MWIAHNVRVLKIEMGEIAFLFFFFGADVELMFAVLQEGQNIDWTIVQGFDIIRIVVLVFGLWWNFQIIGVILLRLEIWDNFLNSVQVGDWCWVDRPYHVLHIVRPV